MIATLRYNLGSKDYLQTSMGLYSKMTQLVMQSGVQYRWKWLI